MGAVKKPVRVKWVCGILAADSGLLEEARDGLRGLLGDIDSSSGVWPFDATDYYADEMGPKLLRQFVSFAAAGDPGELARIKLATNEMEDQYSVVAEGVARRRVNLDPGYLTPSKLVLATTKDFSHRIYLRDGIYAEMTLSFNKDGIQAHPWTYADYRSRLFEPFFLDLRQTMIKAGSARS